MKTLPLLHAILALLFIPVGVNADTIVDSGSITGSSGSTGSYVAETATFTLTAGELDYTELFAEFALIDDGLEISVNGNSLFLSNELSQFGPQDFMSTVVQPNDIADPWTTNSNGIPRLTIRSSLIGTAFSGSVDTSAASAVEYLPNFTVEDFRSFLQVGNNTIDFINHNGSASAQIDGRYSVTVFAVPEPGTLALLGLMPVIGLLRRPRRS
jgi:hypothetical protein